jgi:hypothetical protein
MAKKKFGKFEMSMIGGFTLLIMAIVILLAYQLIQSVPAETLGIFAIFIPLVPYMGLFAFLLVLIGFILIVFFILVRMWEKGKKVL